MLVADVGRGLLIATIPVAYALGHLTWAQLYVVAFGSGVLSVFFYVAYGGFFQTIVEREDYVAANSLTHGSRAFSFLAGTSIGGVLVQVLRGPYALAIDACSFLWSALFLGRIDAVDPPAARRESTGGIMAGARWIRAQRDHPRRAARRRDAQLLQLHATSRCSCSTRRGNCTSSPAALGLVLGAASVGTLARLGRHRRVVATIRRRARLPRSAASSSPRRSSSCPLAGGPHWLVLALPVHRRVLLRASA